MMSNLVRSTYEQLVSRLQRGGTQLKATTNDPKVMGFNVFKDGTSEEASYIHVDISMWHQKNVYSIHDDKVQVTLSHLSGQQTQFTFFPRVGNAPPLDKVEAKIREALSDRILRDEGDAKREADRQDNLRLAEQECPKPEGSGITFVRCNDGKYEVTAYFSGLKLDGLRQLLEIERTRDAVFQAAREEPLGSKKPVKQGRIVQVN